MNNEDKMMDKINKKINILDNLLLENNPKHIKDLLVIEEELGNLYDLLKHYKSIIEQIQKETRLGMRENTNNNDYAKGLFSAYNYINNKINDLLESEVN